MYKRIKRRFNLWLFQKYKSIGKVPFVFRVCPLFSPSMFTMGYGEQIVKWFNERNKRRSTNKKGGKKVQVSHSRVETFKKCPYQFKLRYKDELETYFNCDPANPLIIGTALHTGIEKDTQTAIEEYYANYPVITDKHIEEAIKLESVIQKCRDALPPLDNAIFELELNCPEFKGFIDLLIPLGENEYGFEMYDMYDFKYSNNVKNYMESGQLHEYKFYFEKLNPTKSIRNMYFLFAPKVAIRQKYKNKTNKRDETIGEFRRRLNSELKNKEAQLLEVNYQPEKVREFLRNAKECREATTFPKQPTRLCDWCEFQKYCESDEKEDIDIMNLPKNERRTVAANDHKKIWLYGAPFSGKTYFANQFPDPLMLNTDGNIKYVDAPYIPIRDEVSQEGRVTKRKFAWEIFKETIAELEKGSDFETIVVDLAEDVYDTCRAAICDSRGWEHESDDSFKAYDIVRNDYLRTLKRLFNLDYNIVLISHEDTARDITKKSNDKVTQIKPNIQEKLANKIAGMVDIVGRVINDDGVHKISFKTNEVVFGGGRLNLNVLEIPCDYEELCKVYDEANGKVTKKNGKKKKEKPAETLAEEKKEEIAAAREDESTEVETADAPPKRKTRTRKAAEEPTEKVEELVEEAPAEEEAPKRRRRRKTE